MILCGSRVFHDKQCLLNNEIVLVKYLKNVNLEYKQTNSSIQHFHQISAILYILYNNISINCLLIFDFAFILDKKISVMLRTDSSFTGRRKRVQIQSIGVEIFKQFTSLLGPSCLHSSNAGDGGCTFSINEKSSVCQAPYSSQMLYNTHQTPSSLLGPIGIQEEGPKRIAK